jgi:hypothetical protein
VEEVHALERRHVDHGRTAHHAAPVGQAAVHLLLPAKVGVPAKGRRREVERRVPGLAAAALRSKRPPCSRVNGELANTRERS